MSGVFLAVSYVLCFWMVFELDRLNNSALEMKSINEVYIDIHLIQNPDEINGGEDELIFRERNITNQIVVLLTSLDPDKGDQNRLRKALLQRFELEDWDWIDDSDSRKRLETVYTPKNISKLYPLLSEMRDHFRTRYGKTFMRSQELKAYLKLFAAFLSISLGTSIVGFEVFRRKTAHALAAPLETA